jgi:hypothetical protein
MVGGLADLRVVEIECQLRSRSRVEECQSYTAGSGELLTILEQWQEDIINNYRLVKN